MIVTVTLNPAFDHLLQIPDIILGSFNRAKTTTRMPGGKGINVASSLSILGDEVIATGLLGGQDCAIFEGMLRKIGVTTNFIYVDQVIRTDFFIMEEGKCRQTLIVEKGSPIELRYLNSFKANFERLLSSVDLVEIGGSLPSGVAPNFIRDLVTAANKKKIKVVLNLPEDCLQECMQGTKQFIVYPDLRENKTMFGKDIYDPQARLEMIKELRKKDVEIIILKFGNLNYIVASKDEIWEGEIELGDCTVMIGVRDAFLAGFIHKHLEKDNLGESLKYGLGAGRSAALNNRNHPKSKQEVDEFYLMAKVRKVG
jgi:tagatose 6-phosphate kinase